MTQNPRPVSLPMQDSGVSGKEADMNEVSLSSGSEHIGQDFRAGPALSEAAPSGFVLVPREPTHDMLNAFYDAPAMDDSDDSDWRKSYRAMLAAAPKEQK